MRWRIPLVAVFASFVALSCDGNPPTATPETAPDAAIFAGQPVITLDNGMRMVDLGVLQGEDPTTLSTAYGMNRQGNVVGVSGSYAFLWERRAGFKELNVGWAEAVDINERRHVVGDRDFGCPDLAMGFIWRRGMYRDLGTILGSDPALCQAGSAARAVNNRGQVVGWSEVEPFDPNVWHQHGFLWQDGAMTDLGSLGMWSEAWGINESRQIVGYTDSDDGAQACIWEAGDLEPRPIGWLEQGWSIAVAINNWGVVAGWSSAADGHEHAFRWRNGRMEDLGSLEGDYPWSKGRAINERGTIVGVSVAAPNSDFSGRATLWVPGAEPFDLGTLPGGSNSSAFAINDRGLIAGWSDTESGEFHVVLWIL
ncbi:MAG: hypothetical protein KJO44_00820 [Gemmatimonadetes bacterium]|nr:hypothetical protein [Gemmatimonadota bacterium]